MEAIDKAALCSAFVGLKSSDELQRLKVTPAHASRTKWSPGKRRSPATTAFASKYT